MHFEPSYTQLHLTGELDQRVARARTELENCLACPRRCGINRLANERKVCHVGRHAVVSSAFAHFGEEYCLSGQRGSGTIFFASCNLRCVFCQNHDISQSARGREMTCAELADVMLELQERGCHNINFVTPEHVAPQVVEAIAEAVERGLCIPIVYNSSAYDATETLEVLDGLIDIYMPDIKCWNPATAGRLLGARDYPEMAKSAIRDMYHQVGDLKTDENGIAFRGLLVRHLVMPGLEEESRSIMEWIAEEISRDTYVNIMGQYRPAHKVGMQRPSGKTTFRDINRTIYREEVRKVYAYARKSGLWRFDEQM